MSPAGFTLQMPLDITTGLTDPFVPVYGKNRKRDTGNLPHDLKESTKRFDRQTGLNNVNFTLDEKQYLLNDWAVTAIYTVDMHCDELTTAWCD